MYLKTAILSFKTVMIYLSQEFGSVYVPLSPAITFYLTL